MKKIQVSDLNHHLMVPEAESDNDDEELQLFLAEVFNL